MRTCMTNGNTFCWTVNLHINLFMHTKLFDFKMSLELLAHLLFRIHIPLRVLCACLCVCVLFIWLFCVPPGWTISSWKWTRLTWWTCLTAWPWMPWRGRGTKSDWWVTCIGYSMSTISGSWLPITSHELAPTEC